MSNTPSSSVISAQPKTPAQYDAISSAYSGIYPSTGAPSTLPCGAFEEAQFHHALTSARVSLHGARVLELACGNGFYSSRYLDWGAARVVGVDISAGMVAVAEQTARARGVSEEVLRFVVGDATDSRLQINSGGDDGLFDVVACAWLLNYADNAKTMTGMWDVVARHLRPGGSFVGLTISPLVTPGRNVGIDAVKGEAALLDCAMQPDGVWGKIGQRGKVLEVVDEGLKVVTELGYREKGEDVAVFESYYLGMVSFETSIAACLVNGSQTFEGLEWQESVVTEGMKKDKPVGYWNESVVFPACRVCIARRTA